MKLTLLLCFFSSIIFTSAHAKVGALMKCLGHEEYRLHKTKTTGPIYNLNQTFINEISTIPNIILTENHFNEVCHSTEFGPSVALLRLMLTEGRSAFGLEKVEDGMALAQGQLNTLIDSAPHLFFKYLNQIEASLPHAHCLTQNIPEVKFYYERYQFLESEVSGQSLMKNKNKIKKIFRKLKGLDRMISQCEKEEKERIKREDALMK